MCNNINVINDMCVMKWNISNDNNNNNNDINE